MITVVVPVYNSGEWLGKCLDSIIGQSYANLEIIVVNDGSTDGSAKIIGDYARRDKRVVVVEQKNLGLSAARNAGIKKARGKSIGFVDADDYIGAGMYEYLHENMKKHGCDIGVCGWRLVENGNLRAAKFALDAPLVLDAEQATDWLLRHVSYDNFACNKLFKRELFREVEFPAGKKMEDLMTIYKLLAEAQKVFLSAEPFYNYVLRDGSLTHALHNGFDEQAYGSFEARYRDIKKMYPRLKVRNEANFATANRMYYEILMRTNDKALTEKWGGALLANMRKRAAAVLLDSSIPPRVKMAHIIICIMPRVFYGARKEAYGIEK